MVSNIRSPAAFILSPQFSPKFEISGFSRECATAKTADAIAIIACYLFSVRSMSFEVFSNLDDARRRDTFMYLHLSSGFDFVHARTINKLYIQFCDGLTFICAAVIFKYMVGPISGYIRINDVKILPAHISQCSTCPYAWL